MVLLVYFLILIFLKSFFGIIIFEKNSMLINIHIV